MKLLSKYFWVSVLICGIYFTPFAKPQGSPSIFDTIDTPQKTPQDNTFIANNSPAAHTNSILQPQFPSTPPPPPTASTAVINENNLQEILEKLKDKVTNPYLKDNFTLANLANFFANLISGNQFVNNLEVKELTEMSKAEVSENLKVKGDAQIENLEFNKLKTKALTIDDNEITFDPDTSFQMKNSKVAFKIRDVFEVITFMKYIVQICGTKLEKCDFNNLIKDYIVNQMKDLVAKFQKKQETAKNEERAAAIKNLRKEKDTIAESQGAKPSFKQKVSYLESVSKEDKHREDIETELDKELKLSQDSARNYEDYNKFLNNPQMAQLMSNYYYDMPTIDSQMSQIPFIK